MKPRTTTADLRWNWPHLLLLASLLPFAWLSGAADLAPSTMLTLGTILALVLLMLAERRWPARPQWGPSAHELRRDGAFLALNAVADAAAALMLTWLAIHWATVSAPGMAAHWAPWIAVPAAVVLGELGPYVVHRWSHRGGWTWLVHSVHHAPERVNASNNLTTHPINVLWNQFTRTLPWLLFGFDAQVIAWAALFIQVQSFAVHANVSGTIGPLNRWIGSAELHRWHHSVVPGEALNFGTALPVWDQVFGSYKAPSVNGPVVVGIKGQPVGSGWRSWRKLLLAPLCQRCAI